VWCMSQHLHFVDDDFLPHNRQSHLLDVDQQRLELLLKANLIQIVEVRPFWIVGDDSPFLM
jgi:hypothetical protein